MVTVVMVLADVPVGSPAREGAEVVCSLLPLLQRYGGSAPLGGGEGQEGGVLPPVLCLTNSQNNPH
jgi:hypothetical protein